MAQKELLFYVKTFKQIIVIFIVLSWSVNSVKAGVKQDMDQEMENTGWVVNLVKNSQENVFSAIKEKYIELQRMLSNSKGGGEKSDEKLIQDMFGNSTSLRVFVSSSMSNELLKAYINEAKKYKAIIVFKGLPNGSWKELSKLVSEIIDNDDAVSIEIDDEAFNRFGIKSVPSFVLSKDDREQWQMEGDDVFDKARGNIGIRGFLRLVAEEGDLADEARIYDE